MKRKPIIARLLIISSLAAGTHLAAQTPEDAPPPPPFHQHGPPDLTAMLTNTLDLTDAQKTQVATLVDAVKPQLEAIHQQARIAADAVIKQLNSQIRPLLNAEQQKKLDALEARRAAGPGPGAPE